MSLERQKSRSDSTPLGDSTTEGPFQTQRPWWRAVTICGTPVSLAVAEKEETQTRRTVRRVHSRTRLPMVREANAVAGGHSREWVVSHMIWKFGEQAG